MANSSDDNAMMKRIMATHGLGNHEITVHPILEVIKCIVERRAVAVRTDHP